MTSQAELKRARENSLELKKLAESAQLVFQMSSEKVGQKTAIVPVSVLKDKPLSELCKGLFIGLNSDTINDFTPLLPAVAERKFISQS